ncbi:GGDEF and EAL domain-containing protein [Sphingomonas sp.]|uniref:putative bifunctional diguanylate cyclase/phosphodiesterase n=1 Tax=Sphingomonas sp. TaxID=28214 RepID=UPI0025DC0840|nr:GGDEF and EAL domain-containing protein [Sphingomonas sp.]MBV9526744.1 EAL domain-containing protein [Sphingomonas sp.]
MACNDARVRSVLQHDILPKSRLARWIVAHRSDVSPAIAAHLTSGLYASVPIFLGGVINSVIIAAIGVARHPSLIFFLWLGAEIVLGISRLGILVAGKRALAGGRQPPISASVALSCAWAASVGFGAYASIASQDWILAVIACLSCAGMVSGICLRNFGTPRLVMVMMVFSMLPCALAALVAPERSLLVISIQLPTYMVTIGFAAFRLNGMVVARMTAQDALEKSEAFNRSILESSPDYTLLLDRDGVIAFCNCPQAERTADLLGVRWLDMLPDDVRDKGEDALQRVTAGETARLTVWHPQDDGGRWFDVAVSPISDGSNLALIVARDVTDQKRSEERALWMANHDAMTELPNRVVLQSRLDELASLPSPARDCALLVLDVDNFKLINDTCGHDAGDALLCAFADRLRSSLRPEDLVTRLGGDEFAIVLQARSDAEIAAASERIFARLKTPFAHSGRELDCNASIGAALFPRDGAERSELMKAADMALYAAKTAGRGQLKIFHSSMRNQFQTRNSMIYLARRALDSDGVLPHYQPKVNLRSGRIVGFEALLRWRDPAGCLRLPDKLQAAFDDPTVSAAISDRIIESTLADIRRWIDAGIDFGHVAINASAGAFRSGNLAQELIDKLEDRGIPAACLQVEVTETVFLGQGADHVKRALRRLNSAGVRIALDDFGTGHASLAHLMQFPVDALKIDRSFIHRLGRSGEAEAITKAIVNLGQSLDIEVVAEGVETPEQELHLIGLGCHTGQGYLYSKAIPARIVGEMLTGRVAKSA